MKKREHKLGKAGSRQRYVIVTKRQLEKLGSTSDMPYNTINLAQWTMPFSTFYAETFFYFTTNVSRYAENSI